MSRIDWWHVAAGVLYLFAASIVAFGLWAFCAYFLTLGD